MVLLLLNFTKALHKLSAVSLVCLSIISIKYYEILLTSVLFLNDLTLNCSPCSKSSVALAVLQSEDTLMCNSGMYIRINDTKKSSVVIIFHCFSVLSLGLASSAIGRLVLFLFSMFSGQLASSVQFHFQLIT